MRPVIITQARMSSSRLPGKVLRQIEGKPLIEYHLERLRRCRQARGIIVATSFESSDDPIEEFCKRDGVECQRGSLQNVAERYCEILELKKINCFVRVTADSPLIDYHLIDQGIKVFLENDYDLVTNVFPRSFPMGCSFEVLKTAVFAGIYSKMSSPQHFEHITSYFYENAVDFKIYNLNSGVGDYSKVHLSVDNEEDMSLFRMLVQKMDKDSYDYGWQEILEMRNAIIKQGSSL